MAEELVVKINGDNSGLKASLNDSIGSTKNAFAQMAQFAAAAGASTAVFGAALKGIEFNKAAEQAQISFGVMLGSAEKAKDMLKDLKDFANKTPLEFKDLRDASQTLVQFGLTGKQATDMIKRLGDVSGGNAEKLKSLALSFGQMSSTGRLMGQDLNQMINAGFNPLLTISEKTGKSMAQLKLDMEKGAISTEMVTQAFTDATSEGGRFYGMLEQQGQTLAGVQSTLNDAFETFLGAMTEAASGPLKAFSLAMTDIFNAITALPGPVLAFVGTVVGLTAAVIAVGAAISLLGPIIAGVGAVLMANPIGLILGAVAIAATGLAVAFGSMGDASDNLVASVKEQNSELAKNRKETTLLLGNTDGLNGQQKISAETVQKLIDLYPQLTGKIIANNTTMKEAKELIRAEDFKKAGDTYKQIIAERVKAEKDQADRKYQLDIDLAQRQDTLAKKLKEDNQSQISMAREQVNETQKELKALQDKVDKLRAAEKAAQALFKSMSQAGAKGAEQEILNAQRKQEEEEKALKAQQATAQWQRDHAEEIKKTQAEITDYINAQNDNRMAAFERSANEELAKAKSLGIDVTALKKAQAIERAKIYEEETAKTKEEADKQTKVITEAWKSVVDTTVQSLNSIMPQLSNTFSAMGNLFKDIIDTQINPSVENILSTIGSAIGVIGGLIKDIGQMVADGIKNQLDELAVVHNTALEQLEIQKEAAMIAAGVATQTAVQKAQGELDAAKAGGDAQNIKKAQDALTRAKIDEDYAKKKTAIDKKYAYDKARLEYAGERAAWETQIGSTIAAGAMGIVNAWASSMALPFPANVITAGVLTGLIGGVTGAQLAILGSNPPKMPAFATGTNFAPGGMALVGEQGPEIVNLPRGASVATNAESRGMMGNQTFIFNSPVALDEREIQRQMLLQSRNMAFEMRTA